MSDYFNNIFDLIPKKTSKSGSVGDVVPKKKKQKAGGVTGMSNEDFSLDEFLSPENVAKDVFELPPSESTSTQSPLILTDTEQRNLQYYESASPEVKARIDKRNNEFRGPIGSFINNAQNLPGAMWDQQFGMAGDDPTSQARRREYGDYARLLGQMAEGANIPLAAAANLNTGVEYLKGNVDEAPRLSGILPSGMQDGEQPNIINSLRNDPDYTKNNPFSSFAQEMIFGFLGFPGKLGKKVTGKLAKGSKDATKDISKDITEEFVPKQFKSEIDWSKWNPETPKHKVLMDEYLEIEKRTKADGTWMKNSDGTPFTGKPEQFIQQQSSFFKKAFPEGFEETYRGSDHYRPELRDAPYFTSPHLDMAAEYGDAENVFSNPLKLGNKYERGLYHYYYPKSKNNIVVEGKGSDWTEINTTETKTLETLKKELISNERTIQKIKEGKVRADLHSQKRRSDALVRRIENYGKSEDPKMKELQSFANPSGKRRLLVTDEIADYIEKAGLDNAKIRDIYDPYFGDVEIIMNKPGNRLKSRLGNVGFFDMTNPNIYKGLSGAIGTGALLSQDKPTYRFGGMVKGDPEKPPKKKKWNVPDFTDVTWTKADLDYANRNYLCEEGACLDRSFQAYDKVVAPFIPGMPSSSQFKKDYNFTSAPTPNYKNNYKGYYFPLSSEEGDNRVYRSDGSYGKGKPVSDKTQKWFENQKGFNIEKNDFTIDSWDASAKLIEAGGVNVFSEKRNKDYLYYEEDGARVGEDLWRSKTKAEKLKIYKSLPIGTYVGFNNYPVYSGYNKEKGLASSGHSAQVVGYNEEGIPIIYDQEAYTTIDNPYLYNESAISNITIPKHSIGKTKDYFASKNLLLNEQKDLNLDLTELYAEGDEGELKPFYETLVKFKKELMPKLKISSDTYDEYAKNLLAIAMQETGGGTSAEHNVFGNSFGDTHGLTQLNLKNIMDDPELKDIAQQYHFNEDTDLSDPYWSALASMIYHSRHQKVANQAYSKGRKNNKPLPGVRTYKEQKNKPLKDAARYWQGKEHTYKDDFFKTEEGPIVDLWWGDNTSPLGDWDGWQASLENIQGQLDEIKKGRYKAYKKDGEILINKNTYGNTELTPSERAIYSWSGYETLRTGDAQGGNIYFKNVKKWRDLIKDK